MRTRLARLLRTVANLLDPPDEVLDRARAASRARHPSMTGDDRPLARVLPIPTRRDSGL